MRAQDVVRLSGTNGTIGTDVDRIAKFIGRKMLRPYEDCESRPTGEGQEGLKGQMGRLDIRAQNFAPVRVIF